MNKGVIYNVQMQRDRLTFAITRSALICPPAQIPVIHQRPEIIFAAAVQYPHVAVLPVEE